MKENLNSVLKWFGYTRRERRSSFILLIILVLIITIRYTFPDKPMDFEIIRDSSLLNMVNGYLPSSENTVKEYSGSALFTGLESGQKQDLTRSKKSFSKLNLNGCDSTDFEKMPYLGPVLSSRIVKYRNLLGGFVSVSQLKEVYGLSDSAFLFLSGRFFVDTSAVKKININRAIFSELLRHPYLDRYDVQSILKYRDLSGSVGSIDLLVENMILTREKADRIEPYLSFEK